MFNALVLVRNIESGAERLDFGEFTVNPVGFRFKDLREVFSSEDVNQDDWVFEKSYPQLPTGPPGSAVGGIPNDIEDTLLLLRLYRPGDISFIKQVVVQPSGRRSLQVPYRAMNDLNSYAGQRFEVKSEDCVLWGAFADIVRQSQSWSSGWFAAARRFFLTGGAKPFDRKSGDVDRIVDYATALEAALVPETDYNAQRISRRAAALIAPDDPAQAEVIVRFIRRFYGIRSRIVHGTGLGDKERQWLSDNCGQVELRVRQVLKTAVQKLPPGEQDRQIALAELYDLTDADRGNSALEKFREIKTAEVRKAIAAKIAELARE